MMPLVRAILFHTHKGKLTTKWLGPTSMIALLPSMLGGREVNRKRERSVYKKGLIGTFLTWCQNMPAGERSSSSTTFGLLDQLCVFTHPRWQRDWSSEWSIQRQRKVEWVSKRKTSGGNTCELHRFGGGAMCLDEDQFCTSLAWEHEEKRVD